MFFAAMVPLFKHHTLYTHYIPCQGKLSCYKMAAKPPFPLLKGTGQFFAQHTAQPSQQNHSSRGLQLKLCTHQITASTRALP